MGAFEERMSATTTQSAAGTGRPSVNAPTAPTSDVGRRPGRVAIVGLTVIAAVAVWGAARLLGIEVSAPSMDGTAATTVGVGHVLAASSVASLAGWALLAGLERLQPRRASVIWLITAGVVFLLSLGTPLTGEGITAGDRAALAALHVAVAGVLVSGLWRTRRRAAARTHPTHTRTGERS